jgi:hypothetical protein
VLFHPKEKSVRYNQRRSCPRQNSSMQRVMTCECYIEQEIAKLQLNAVATSQSTQTWADPCCKSFFYKILRRYHTPRIPCLHGRRRAFPCCSFRRRKSRSLRTGPLLVLLRILAHLHFPRTTLATVQVPAHSILDSLSKEFFRIAVLHLNPIHSTDVYLSLPARFG